MQDHLAPGFALAVFPIGWALLTRRRRRRRALQADEAEQLLRRAVAPHLDPLVLHAPGECAFCDRYPERQQLRALWGLNFTGHREPGKFLCPSEGKRPLERIEATPENRPHPEL